MQGSIRALLGGSWVVVSGVASRVSYNLLLGDL